MGYGTFMSTVIDILLLVLASLLAVPTGVLAAEVLLSLLSLGRSTADTATKQRPRVGVVIPAHNEEVLLGRTLEALRPQLNTGDRIIVVADNCIDNTAAVARAAGAVCIERIDDLRRGKGFALDAGVRALKDDPPAVVVFTDADVHVHAGAIELLVRQVERTGQPAQGEYLMELPHKASSVDLVSRFAFTLKNKVRPLGLWKLGLPVPLFGAGMAFPWETISTAPLASGDLVEDMRLGIELCRNGQAPLFCPNALFRGMLPGNIDDANMQRRRWEHGHLSVFRDVPALLLGGLVRLSGRTVAMALDHLVQPLTVLCLELLVVLALSLIWWWTRGSVLGGVAAIVAAGGVGLMAIALLVAWAAHMRREIPPKALLGLPRYLTSRARNQSGWLFHRQQDWVRTARPESSAPSPQTSGDDAGKPPPDSAPGTSRPDLAPARH